MCDTVLLRILAVENGYNNEQQDLNPLSQTPSLQFGSHKKHHAMPEKAKRKSKRKSKAKAKAHPISISQQA